MPMFACDARFQWRHQLGSVKLKVSHDGGPVPLRFALPQPEPAT
jgi:hypothetical protein